ncbi:hypothetical protein FE257_009309 [Aspergillus nanangensis]|uniref:Zn(2)-C6 fungal-type domain-containing protein n=1 Tax=Aspergillus nanangensis TaxID=2582783 RepID=A0AAD4CK75_ASPNN|nr:hypothetical protein FE257_009309 [Aspergillus nanangensis]
MQGRTKRTGGCWTCRLRRKKCDEVHPVCGECHGLEIPCHNDETKPPWMDGGASQAQMRERIKAETKRIAARRRGRHHIESLSDGREVETTFIDVLQTRSGPAQETRSPTTTSAPVLSPSQWSGTSYQTRPDSSPDTGNDSSLAAYSTTTTSTGEASVVNETPVSSRQGTPAPSLADEETQFWIMTYLDFVIPALFPFYKPRLVDGGRAWMLVLLTKNQTLYHIAVGLSSYLFSVELASLNSAHHSCSTVAWDKLQHQMQAAFQALNHSLQESARQGMEDNLLHHAGLMESIVQLVNMEVVMAHCEDWQVHLDAVIRLFEQIFQHHGMLDGYPRLDLLLEKIGQYTWKLDAPRPPETTIRTAEQNSVLFFISLVLVYDILGSTSTGQAPRLQAYHPALLDVDQSPHSAGSSSLSIALDTIIGCENWVMVLIGETAALHAWKKQCRTESRLSMMELATKAHLIEGRLQEGIHRLEAAISPTGAMGRYRYLHRGTDTRLVTLIWAYATHAYLHVTVSGWQVHNIDVRRSVGRVIELLTMLPDPAGLRATVWPFCLAGCLATVEEEQMFRDMASASASGSLGNFSGLRMVLNLLEKVWVMREEASSMDWDLSVCFGVLDYPAFLV